MRPLGSSARGRLAFANLAGQKPGAARRGLLGGVLLAVAVFGGAWGAASSVAHAATLDLNGIDVILPDKFGVFTTPYLTGSNDVTNTSLTPLSPASLSEGGGPAGTTYSGVISGPDPITWVHSGGDVIITGVNNYDGSTSIDGGNVTISGAGTLGGTSNTPLTVMGGAVLDLGGTTQTQNSSVTLDGGTIQNGTFSSSGEFLVQSGTVSAVMAGTGTGTLVQAGGGGTATLSGANTYTGETSVFGTGQALDITGAGTLGNAANFLQVANGAVLDLGGTTQTQNGGVALNGGTIQNGSLSSSNIFGLGVGTVSADLVGTGRLSKTIAGTLTLSGANTYTGQTAVGAGTLMGGAANAFSAASATTVFTGGTLDLGGFAQAINTVNLAGGTIQNGTLTGAIASTGGAVNGIGGSATLTANSGTTTLSGANTYTGATTVNNTATLLGGAANAFSATSATTVNTGGTLDLGGLAQTINTLNLAGGAIRNGTLTSSTGGFISTGGTVDGIGGTIGLTVNGGVTTLNTTTGPNTYSGGTMINFGTLLGGATNAFSAASGIGVGAGGTVDLGGFAQAINTVNLAGGVVQDGTLTSLNGITSFGGTVDGIGGTTSLTVSSGVTALKTTTGSNTYTGLTTINGGTLLGGAANAFSAASATTVAGGGTLDLGGFNQTVSSLAGSGTVTNSGASAAVLTNVGASSTFSGVIQDGASKTGLTQNSAGNTLTLTGANNTYSGPTTVAAGTLKGGATNTFSANSATSVLVGGTLDLGNNGQTINNVSLAGGTIQNGSLTGAILSSGGEVANIGGSAPLTANSGRTILVGGGLNFYSGTTTVNNGATLLGNGFDAFSPFSAMTVNTGGTLDVGGFFQVIGALSGGGTVTNNGSSAAGLTIDSVVASTTFSGSIKDGTSSIGLTTNGGDLTLSGTNTYTGLTVVNNASSTLSAGRADAFSAASLTLVIPGATLDLGGFAQTIDNVDVIGGLLENGQLTGAITSEFGTTGVIQGISGSASLTASPCPTSIVIGSCGVSTATTTTLQGTNSYTGATIVNSGATLLGGAANAFSAASATTVNAGGTLDLGGFNQTVSSLAGGGTVANSGLAPVTLTNQGASSTFSGVIQDGSFSTFVFPTSLVQNSPGNTLTLTGANTYTGGTAIAAGTLQIGGAGTLGAGSYAGAIVNNGTFEYSSSANQILSGGISGSGALTKDASSSTLTLLGVNTYTGPTTVSAGTLQIGGAGTLGAGSYSGAIVNNGTFEYSSSAAQTLSGAISGSGSLVKDTSSSVLTLTGTNAYTGATTINAGTLRGGAANTFSDASATTVAGGGTLDLGGFNQTVSSLAGIGTVTNNALTAAILTNQGASSTFSGVIKDGASPTAMALFDVIAARASPMAVGLFEAIANGANSMGLTQNSAGNTLTLSGAHTYSGSTTVLAGTLMGGALNAFSAASATTVDHGGTLDLGGLGQTINTVNLAGGAIQHGALASSGGVVSGIVSAGGVVDGIGGTTGLTVNSGVTTLKTTTGANTYTSGTTVNSGTLLGGATDAFSAASATKVNTGGTLDLGGFTQRIDTLNLAGGAIQHGALTSSGAIVSAGGVVDGIGGTTGLTVNSGLTTLKTATGPNTYTVPTTVNGGTLLGGATNAFSAASPTTVNAGGTLDLGGLSQRIDTLNVAGGVIENGALVNTGGITSSNGMLSGVAVLTTGQDGHAVHVAGAGSQLNLVGGNTFTTQGAGASGLSAALGSVISATGSTLVNTSGAAASGVNADGAGAQIRLGSATVRTTGAGAFGLFASDGSASGGAGSISATGTLNVSTANPAAATIGLQGNGASIVAAGGGNIASAANVIELLGGTNQTATFDSFDFSTQTGDIVLADPSSSTVTFNNSTLNAGTGYLLDATGGSVITFNASGSTLTGAMATDATAKSNVALTNGTLWNLTGPSNVSNLAVTNSSVVFAAPGAGGFKTLTVNNYAGSGANIVLNTALGGSSSPTDRIVINGGSATGNTLLTIRNVGGVGAQTTGAGIPIVTTTNGGTTAPNAFTLASTPAANGYGYALDDSGGDWYLVSSPTTTLAQVQSSLKAVSKAQLGQIVNNNLLSSTLLGATQQINCSNCVSGFGAFGSLAGGTQGRLGLTDRLTAIGGFSYNQWSASGISVNNAPTIAGALLYDFDNFGSSRPFVEAGGSLTPYESIHGSRVYPNGLTMATGTWTSLDRNLSLFARAGWLARLTPIDEAAAYAIVGRNWLQTGGYTEPTTAINAYPVSAAPAVQALNMARVGAQYTHLFTDNIEVNIGGAVIHGVGAGTGSVANVASFGRIGPTPLPTTTWFEYGARAGLRLTDSLVVDAFVLGSAGGGVGSVHGGIALRSAF
jgi:autotransporter-associated beta strand protein